jgi:hypothetical protein
MTKASCASIPLGSSDSNAQLSSIRPFACGVCQSTPSAGQKSAQRIHAHLALDKTPQALVREKACKYLQDNNELDGAPFEIVHFETRVQER